MAINFTSATGNLFNRLGKLGVIIKNIRSLQVLQQPALIDVTTGIVAQYNAEPDIQAIVGSSYINLLNSGITPATTMQRMAAATVNRMVYRDNPSVNGSLTSGNTLASLREIIRQMKAASASVRSMTITGTPGTFTGLGDGTVNVSVKRPSDGITLENSFTETLLLTCQTDSYSSTAIAGNESFLLTGQTLQSNPFVFDWPQGSGARANLSAIDGAASNASGNVLTNSGFDAFTSNVPDNFVLQVGTAGTNVFLENSITFDAPPNTSLRFRGDGSTLIELTQLFNDTTGTIDALDPLTQYSLTLWMRRGGSAVSAGVLEISLVDDGFNMIHDEAGNANSITINLTTLTTNYLPQKGCFRTPANLPTTIYLRLRLTTAISNGSDVYLDKMGLGIMTQSYISGPYLAVHAGAIPFEIADFATCAVSNSRGVAGTYNTFQTLLARLFPSEVYGNELIFPSNAAPTVDDALIA